MDINIHFDFLLPLVLTIIFIILKKMNIISWAWYWILSPLWIMGIIILIIFIVLIVFIILNLKGWL